MNMKPTVEQLEESECMVGGHALGCRCHAGDPAKWILGRIAVDPILPPAEPQQPKAANLTELFHNSLTNRGKQVLANQAVEDLERQDSETP